MAQKFELNFNNGVAPTTNIDYGSYNLSFSGVTGYDTATIDPSTLNVDGSTSTALPITLTADGTATVTITDKSTVPVPITTGVSFLRYVSLTDEVSYTPVSGVITNVGSGVYTINFLPYVTTGTHNVYFKVSAPNKSTADFTIPMNQKEVTGLTLKLDDALPADATLQDVKFTGYPLTGKVTGTPQ